MIGFPHALVTLLMFPAIVLGGLFIGLGAGLVLAEKRARSLIGLGVGLGLVFGLVLAVVEYSTMRKDMHAARAGWNLAPVVVAAVDIEPGTIVTFDHISQRSLPEQFVTSTMVKPDQAADIVNVRIRGGLRAGDVLLHGMFCSK